MVSYLRGRLFSPSESGSSGHLFHPRGFTLVELSIVMAIIGVMVASALGAYKVMIVKEYRDTTNERMDKIKVAISKYKTANGGYFPCPSDLYAAPDSPDFGKSVGNCATAPSIPGAILAVNPLSLPAGPAPANTVRRGGVPWRDLGLSSEVASDSWNRRFVYAVSAQLADIGIVPYDEANGAITLLNDAGPIAIPPNNDENKNLFFLFSPGKNGAGGVTYDGKNFPTACPGSGKEMENCNGDNTTYREAAYSESGVALTNFDDYVAHTLDTSDATVTNNGCDTIDCLKDGLSDWPATAYPAPGPTNVCLGMGSCGQGPPAPPS